MEIIMSEGSSSTLLRERLFMKPKFYSKKCFQAPVSKAIINIYEDRKFSSQCYVQFYTRLPWTLWLYWSWSPWYSDIVELDQNSECQVFQKWERQFCMKFNLFFNLCYVSSWSGWLDKLVLGPTLLKCKKDLEKKRSGCGIRARFKLRLNFQTSEARTTDGIVRSNRRWL